MVIKPFVRCRTSVPDHRFELGSTQHMTIQVLQDTTGNLSMSILPWIFWLFL